VSWSATKTLPSGSIAIPWGAATTVPEAKVCCEFLIAVVAVEIRQEHITLEAAR